VTKERHLIKGDLLEILYVAEIKRSWLIPCSRGKGIYRNKVSGIRK